MPMGLDIPKRDASPAARPKKIRAKGSRTHCRRVRLRNHLGSWRQFIAEHAQKQPCELHPEHRQSAAA
jgi:hypothetical protein